jgi:DNA (cytosine-5)-methyltransferase 1
MRVGSIFAGIGGFDLGLERAGFTIEWQCEIDPWCRRVLAKHWPTVKRYGDITAIDWATVPPIDVLCGGFPCQDISVAGKGAGLAGARSGLWSEYAKAIQVLQPQWVIIENVPAVRTRGLDRVLQDLCTSGYDAEWDYLPTGILYGHKRERFLLVAYHSASQGLERRVLTEATWQAFRQHPGTARILPAPRVLRKSDGLPHRVDRFRGLGNAVVPQIVEHIGRSILHAKQEL